MVILFLWTCSIVFIADLLWILEEYPWQRIDENNAPITDAIFVLNGGGRPEAPGKSNIFEWGDPDRYFAGIKLYNKKKAPRLFFAVGTTPYKNAGKDEGNLYKEHAISLGIPVDAISTTNKVFNTAKEAIEIKKDLNQLNSTSKIILVTSAFNMKRAKKLFERQVFLFILFR